MNKNTTARRPLTELGRAARIAPLPVSARIQASKASLPVAAFGSSL